MFSGEKEPLHGTNLNTTWQVRAWIFAVLQMHVSSSLFLQYVWKRSACGFESNSSSIALRSVNWSVLIGCHEVDVTWLVSWSSDRIHSLILPLSTYAAEPLLSLGESATLLSKDMLTWCSWLRSLFSMRVIYSGTSVLNACEADEHCVLVPATFAYEG